MGQEPNIELSEGDLPRRTPQPGAARRWKPNRPGEIESPEEMAVGGAFGRPAADAGYALHLVAQADFDRGRNPEALESILATIATARASHFGRAPVRDDVEVAAILLGLRSERIPSEVILELAAARARAIARAAHEKVKGTAVVNRLSPELLALSPAELRKRLVSEQRSL